MLDVKGKQDESRCEMLEVERAQRDSRRRRCIQTVGIHRNVWRKEPPKMYLSRNGEHDGSAAARTRQAPSNSSLNR